MDKQITKIVWPEKPKCHGISPVFAFGETVWRDPVDREDGPYKEAFRTCSYCGSIHPEDLVRVAAAGATIGGSDWKYGWPHKFYVDNIPNPVAGQMRRNGGVSVGKYRLPTLEDAQKEYPGYSNWRESKHDGWEADSIAPAPAKMQTKWYNEHMLDLGEEAFQLVASVILEKARIAFELKDGKLTYRAPYVGFQT